MKEVKLTATEEVAGFRIDKAVSVLYTDLSRNSVQNMEKQKMMTIMMMTMKHQEEAAFSEENKVWSK